MEHTSAGGNSFSLEYLAGPKLPFKVGDRVRCKEDTHATHPLSINNAVYTVRDINSTYLYLQEVLGGYYHSRFELVRDEPVPTARANDPATSKGKRKVNKYEEEVLTQLRLLGGGTGKEIAKLAGVELNCITPRFAPLRRKGLIKDSGIKRDKQIVWVLA